MLTPEQWNTLLAWRTPDDVVERELNREVRAFLVQFDRELPYTTTEVASGLCPPDKLDAKSKARLFQSLARVRRAMPSWCFEIGDRVLYGRSVKMYGWNAPKGAAMPADAIAATCCPMCGKDLW